MRNYTYVGVPFRDVYVLAISGPSDAGKTTLVERLTRRLSERGRVATVKHLTHEPTIDTDGKDTARHRAAGAAATYGLTDEGNWFATGTDRSLDQTLSELEPDYDYVLVEGYSMAELPTVALGGRDHAGEQIAAAPTADDVDIEAVIDELHERAPDETRAQSSVE